jgi:hypothetical protein
MRNRSPLTPEQERKVKEAMRHVVPAYTGPLTFERVAINGGALCIECKACGRRSSLTAEDCPHIHRGNKTAVASMKFRCGSHACGTSDVRLYNAHTRDEATMFLAGDPMPDGREILKADPPSCG